jgi:pimeloyl-ACP methyl ester carboxylesterase
MDKIGNGPNLVFLHGGGLRYNSYLPLINELSKYFRVYYFNLPGHGHRQTDGDPQSAVDNIYDEINRENIYNPIFVGHSLGGLYAYEVAYKLQSFSSIVLLDPLLNKCKQKKTVLIFKYFISKNLRGLIYHPRLIRFYFKAFIDILVNLYYQRKKIKIFLTLLFNSVYKERIISEDLEKKLLIIHGKNDSMINFSEYPNYLKNKIVLVDGEHDWCMSNPKDTVKQVIKSLYKIRFY